MNKSLIDIPLEDIKVGLKVISAQGTPGKIAVVEFCNYYPHSDIEHNPIIEVHWDNSRTSLNSLIWFKNVKVAND